jgi:tetratricopeptide (TPR) repeat protein
MATDTAALPAPARTDPSQHLWQLPVLLLGVAVFVCAWKGWLPPFGPADPGAQFSHDLAALQAAHERARPDATELKNLLGKVAAGVEASPPQAASGHFHLGSGYVRLAEITPAPDEARGYWVLALQHFERVTDKQLRDPGDGPRLVFRTAKARAAVGLPEGAAPAEVVQLLAILSAPQSEEPGETQRLVAELALRLTPPDVARARVALTQYLTATGSATPAASLARGRLFLGTLYLPAPADNEQARKWLEEIGTGGGPEVQAPANAALAKVLMAEGDWQAAAKRLELLRDAPGVPAAIRQGATYQLAACKLRLRQPGAAAPLFEAAARGGGPEARAAAIQLARLRLEGRDPAARKSAADLLAAAVAGVAEPARYDGQLVRLDEAQSAFEQAVAALLADGEYEAALRTAEKYAAVAPPGRDRERRAEVLSAWAEAMLKEKNPDARPTFKAAADEFAALAASQPKPEGKAEVLRRAAELAKKAGDPAASADRLTEALALKALPEPLLQAILFDLADAELALGHPERVLKIYNQIMAPGNDLATAARYRLARAFVDSRHAGLVPVGRALFEQIAEQKNVAPAEREYHERSLTELAHALIREGNFAEAEARLRKQLGTYPNGPEAPLAQLLLGVCLLQRAAAPSLTAGDATRMRTEALANFKRIVADCDAAERRRGKLTEREAWLRLQASLRVLQTHQVMRKPVELLSDAAPLLDRHKNSVEELIILSLVYHAFRQLNDPGKALDTRERMKETFDRLPPSAFPQDKGDYSRDYWQKVWFPPEKP